METLSSLLAFCDGNAELPLQMVSDAELSYFLGNYGGRAVE